MTKINVKKSKPERILKGFKLGDYVSRIVISKNTSPAMLDALNNCNLNCDIVIKD